MARHRHVEAPRVSGRFTATANQESDLPAIRIFVAAGACRATRHAGRAVTSSAAVWHATECTDCSPALHHQTSALLGQLARCHHSWAPASMRRKTPSKAIGMTNGVPIDPATE